MIRPVLLGLALIATACGPTDAGRSAAVASPTGALRSTVPPVNVDDMMGGSFSPATVFALAGGEIAAVKLQNHFVPYRVAVSGKAHAIVSPDGARLYVADRPGGRTRLRAIDTVTGVEMVSSLLGDEALADEVALAQDRPDRLLLLVKAGTGVRVDAVAVSSLAAPSGIYKSPCGERLLASRTRVAVICSSGSLGVATSTAGELLGPQGGMIAVPGAPVVAAAMLTDGTTIVGTASGKLHVVSGDAGALLPGPEIIGASGGIAAIAAAGDDRYVVLARSTTRSSVLMYNARTGLLGGGPFAVSGHAQHAVALWPFAYFSGSDPGLWHVDLRTGDVERMTPLAGAVPLAVSAR